MPQLDEPGKIGANRRSRSQLIGVALLLAAAMLGLAPGVTAATAEDDDSEFRRLGQLDQPAGARDPLTAGTARVLAIDSEARLLYYSYADPKRGSNTYLREYDLNTPVPRFIREAEALPVTMFNPIQDITPKTSTIDTRRRWLYVMHTSCIPCAEGNLPSPSRAEIIDLKTLKRIGGIDLAATVPGAQLYGITYSPEDDRLYFVGEMNPIPFLGVKNENPEGAIPATVTVIAAIDAATGLLAWMRPVAECQVPLANRFLAALIARSIHQPALYIGCIRPFIHPGESGVLRMWISPTANQAEALQFRTELFPVSGSYTHIDGIKGNAFFDYQTDRFFMQSIALTTPGVWVFDGRISSWAGFIAAPANDNFFVGLNEGRGRYYMGGSGVNPPGYIVAADGRSSPVPQGRVFKLSDQLNSEVFTDSKSKRLIVRVEPMGGQTEGEWVVYEDTATLPVPPKPTEFDALTADIAEGPKTASTFAGGVNGFGARAMLVGGLGGIRTFCHGGLESGTCPIVMPDDPALRELNVDLSPADRAFHAARVGSLDVRNVGASASANALELDPVTDGEYITKVQEPTGERVNDATGNEQLAADVHRMLTWPHHAATCLDGGGKPPPNEATGPGGGSLVVCDLAKQEATAATRFAAFSVAGVSVGSSSFAARVRRDAALGTVTESTAVAKGIELASPDGGTVSIGEIVARASTVAHGRTGTASARWTRTLSDVIVRNAAGEVTFSCTDADSCNPRAIMEAANRALGVRIRIYLPEADQIATPKGAFAGVQKRDADFLNSSTVNNDVSRAVPGLEIVVFNDSVEKSRLLIQLAGIQSSSIYGIALLPEEVGFNPGPSIIPPLPPLPDVLPPTVGPPVGGVVTAPRSPGAKLLSAALFLFRSPKDALLVGLIAMLFIGAGTVAARRRTLLRQLGGGT